MTRSPVQVDEAAREKAADQASYVRVLERLSRASVDKHWDAYADVPWDDPDLQIEPKDPRWTLSPVDHLGATEWYRSLPVEVRAEIGLWRTATFMKIGLQFENVLQRGLLTYAYKLPSGAPEYRYVMHEVVEEGHHSMMFQEFVNRSTLPVRGMSKRLGTLAQVIPWIPQVSTELFLIFALSGEEPIDHVQRKLLRSDHKLHPLAETITRIHIAEEARHISFARHYLKHRVPKLNPVRRKLIALMAPGIVGITARIMLSPPDPMVRRYGIPKQVLRQAYKSPAAKAEMRDCVAKLRDLFIELGLIGKVTKWLWRAHGIWDEPGLGADSKDPAKRSDPARVSVQRGGR